MFDFYITIRCDEHRRHAGRVVFSFGLVRDVVGALPPPAHQYRRHIREDSDVDQAIETQQAQTLSVKFVDRRGRPAQVQGVPVWATDNSDLLTLEPAGDGMSCKVTTGTMPGAAMVQMTADADLGDGVVPLIGTANYTVTNPPATTIELTGDTPADVP